MGSSGQGAWIGWEEGERVGWVALGWAGLGWVWYVELVNRDGSGIDQFSGNLSYVSERRNSIQLVTICNIQY